MSRRAAAALALVLALLAAAGAFAPAFADDAAPAPAPAGEGGPAMDGAGGAGAGGAAKTGTSVEEFEKLLLGKPAVAFAIAVLRFGLLGLALVLVAVALSHRAAVRRGEIPPPLRPPPPIPPLPVGPALLLVIGTMAAGWGVAIALQSAGVRQLSALIAATAVPSLLAAGFVLWIRSRLRGAAGRAPAPVVPALFAGAWTFVVAGSAATVAGLAWQVALKAMGQDVEPQALVLQSVRGPEADAWSIALYGALGAPFAEETLFRGLLLPAARDRFGFLPALVGTSVLFALAHQNVHALVPLFVLALFLGWLAERTDSVLAPFTVHALFNASSLLPLLLFRYA